MEAVNRGRPCLLGLLLSFCLAALPSFIRACPKPCACYVPTEVHCTFRYLKAIPGQIPSDVERINFGYNSLVKLTESDFSGLMKLELLMLHSNEIHTIHEKAFYDLYALQVLKMSYNKVKILHKNTFHGLKNLIRLHIDHNEIAFLNPDVFYELSSLKLVHLEGNMLSRLHPDTFVTLRYIQIFKTSSIKHIYLSDNLLTSLPKEMFFYMSELESIYLHGNPWSCDCNLKWLAEWAQQMPEVIKCKRDRGNSGVQQCPVCANPRKYKGRDLSEIPSADLICIKPTIDRSLKIKNITTAEEGDFISVSSKDFIAPIGSLILNMTDQAGNEAHLFCNVQIPSKLSQISLDRKDNYTVLKTSFSTFLVCNIDYDHIQQLWSILAMYSDSPMKLRRELLLTKSPYISYQYKQINSDGDDVFTNIEAEFRAEPTWLMQDQVTLQLDRTATTLTTLHIRYLTDAQISLSNIDENPPKYNWAMILKTNSTKTEHSIIAGGTVELDCKAIGEPSPVIEWILADGSKVRAPYASEEGKITVSKSGKFTLRAADAFDAGIYHCIGTNYKDADLLTFQITVVNPDVEHYHINGAQLSPSIGDTLYLPCQSTGIPDASVSWVLPDHTVLYQSSRSKHIFSNGTLKIQELTKQDRGYFRCVAANQYGLDILVFEVLTEENEENSKNKEIIIVEEEEKDGSGNEELDNVREHKNGLKAEGNVSQAATISPSRHRHLTQAKIKGNSNRAINHHKSMHKGSRRLWGQKRQFSHSTRRLDPQRWAAFLEKIKKHTVIPDIKENSTANPQARNTNSLRKSSKGEEEEQSSGDDLPTDEEFLILTTKMPRVTALRKIPVSTMPAELESASSLETQTTVGMITEQILPVISPSIIKPERPKEETTTGIAVTGMVLTSMLTSPRTLQRSPAVTTKSLSQGMPTTSGLFYSTSKDVNTSKKLKDAGGSWGESYIITSATPTEHVTKDTTPVTSQHIVHKHSSITDSLNKSSTKSNHEISLMTITEPENAVGHIYFHSTQKIITPGLPPGSTIITHQQIQIIRDVTPNTPIARQRFGRRRISGKRRIVKPDRIPNIKEHRYKFARPELKEFPKASNTVPLTTELGTKGQHLSNNSFTASAPVPIARTTYSPLSKVAILNMPSVQPATTAHKIRGETPDSTAATATHTSSKMVTEPTTEIAPTESTISLSRYTDRTQSFTSRSPTTAVYQSASTDNVLTILSTNGNETYLDLKPMLTPKNRSSSNTLRGKIPWHQFFGNNNIQKEILKTLWKSKTQTTATATSSSIASSSTKTKSVVSGDFALYLTTVSRIINQTSSPDSLTSSLKQDYITTTSDPATPLATKEASPLTRSFNFTLVTTKTKEMPIPAYTDTIISANVSSAAVTTTTLQISTPVRRKGLRRKRPRKKNTILQRITTIVRTPSTLPMEISTYNPVPIQTLIKSTTHKPDSNPFENSSAIPNMSFTLPSTIEKTNATSETALPNKSAHILIKGNQIIAFQAISSFPKSTTSTPVTETSGWLSTEKIQAITVGNAINKKNHFKNKILQHASKALPTVIPDLMTRTYSPAVTHIGYPKIQHPTPLASFMMVTTQPSLGKSSSSPVWGNKFWHKVAPKAKDRGKTITVNTRTILKSPQSYTSYTPHFSKSRNNAFTTWTEKTADRDMTTSNVLALEPLSRNRPTKPRIKGGNAASFTVLANSDAFIPCEATGNPLPTIHWTKISSETSMSKSKRGSNLEVFTNGTLSIQSVSVQDRGQYLCVATNQHGSDRLLVTLSVVAYPPRILEGRLREITVHSGNSVEVKCKAEGRPIPTISWILANKTLVSEFSSGQHRVLMKPDGTLIIKEVTIYDRGIYKCVAINPAGSDVLTIKIQVIAAPPIILEDKRQQVTGMRGDNLKIPCTVKGNPHPSVHWVLVDGTEVKPLQFINSKLFLFSNGTLYIRNLAASDSGKYECIATSSTGSERRVVSIVVEQSEKMPRILTASPKTTALNYGDKLLLKCSASGEPKPRIMWRLPSKAVVDQWHRMGSRIHVYSNGSLFIESVTEKDAGDYLCVARNHLGDDLILMKVSVTMRPAKIDQKQHFKKQVPYGKDFKVDCKASGSPLPEISWSLPDGTMINNVLQADDSGRRFRRYTLFDNGTLYLNKVGKSEEGDYTCYAQNTLGKDEMRVHITVVTIAPQIKDNYRTLSKVQAGNTALFDCEAIGEPKPKIFWLLPSSDMISASSDQYLLHVNGSLSITKVKLLDTGEYMCVARNSAGDDTKLYKLEVASKPPLINGLYSNKTIIKDTAVKYTKKLIDCRAEGTPLPEIMWIMPDNIFLTAPYYGSRIVVHKNGTLEIRNVRASDTAEFVCVARSDGGESVLVVQLEAVDMLRRPMFKNPFNEKIIASSGKTTILNCSADGNPTPEISWLLPNGTKFSNEQKFPRYQIRSNGTFYIYNPTRGDVGKYRCAARNKVGYIEKLIILEVGQKPTILTHPRGAIRSITGESLSLHCLTDGIPKPNIIWTVPSGYVIDRPQIKEKYVLFENGTLVIRQVNIHDKGNYICKAQNSAGETTIVVPITIIAYPPRITNRPPQSIHTTAGAAIQLNCMAIGIPKPDITWELPDHSILSTASKGRPAGSELLHPQGTLVIQNPTPSDSGTYRCIAKNQLGSDFSVTYIKVNEMTADKMNAHEKISG
ncbi:immunoglobulin superfamily member 10 [Rhinatrema bivittatum]|uniref:immunoglobulin superfamily member 10 n=1 Tax=Rhinatrema bivittatum TaxID=194408 RepID=UPI0011294947|nr:immunoglobulin superfamily member 10 [Rhinatrema bivittatum]